MASAVIANLPSKINCNCGVYRLIDRRTGNFYVGSSYNLARRRRAHFNLFERGANAKLLQAAFNAGAEFEFEILMLCEPEFRNQWEQDFVDLLQPVTEDKTEEAHVLELLNDDGARNKAFAGVMDSYHNAPGAEQGTLWGVFNGVTHWADHTAGNRGQEARLTSAWFGERSGTKQQAYNQLLEMVD